LFGRRVVGEASKNQSRLANRVWLSGKVVEDGGDEGGVEWRAIFLLQARSSAKSSSHRQT
jgi:hypothetical protein